MPQLTNNLFLLDATYFVANGTSMRGQPKENIPTEMLINEVDESKK